MAMVTRWRMPRTVDADNPSAWPAGREFPRGAAVRRHGPEPRSCPCRDGRAAPRCTRAPTVITGLSAVSGLLEIIASYRRESFPSRWTQLGQILAVQTDRSTAVAGQVRRQQPHDRERGKRLAAPRLADDSDGLAADDAEGQSFDKRRRASAEIRRSSTLSSGGIRRSAFAETGIEDVIQGVSDEIEERAPSSPPQRRE